MKFDHDLLIMRPQHAPREKFRSFIIERMLILFTSGYTNFLNVTFGGDFTLRHVVRDGFKDDITDILLTSGTNVNIGWKRHTIAHKPAESNDTLSLSYRDNADFFLLNEAKKLSLMMAAAH